MVSNKCVVVNCNDSSKKKHRFPSVHEDCIEWVKRSGNTKLLNLPIEQVIATYQICHKHFDVTCESPGTNGKLQFRSLPTLHLPRNIICVTWLQFMLHVMCVMYTYPM